MGKNPARSARAWNNNIKAAVPDAIDAYDQGLAEAATNYDAKATAAIMGKKYNDSLTKARGRYRSSMTPERAGAGYRAKMMQIATQDFNDYVLTKVENSIKLKQHLGSLAPQVVVLIPDVSSGVFGFSPAGQNTKIKNLIVNIAVMKYSDNFTLDTTAQDIVTKLTAESGNDIGLATGD